MDLKGRNESKRSDGLMSAKVPVARLRCPRPKSSLAQIELCRHNMKNTKRKRFPQPKQIKGLRIIPLGGQEEVGRNMTIFELGNDIVILDMGVQFPEDNMYGIDYIIPNISYLKGKEKNIRAVVFSHGHLDHIGAAPILLEKLGNPLIIGRPLTLGLIKIRQEDYKKKTSDKLKTLEVKSITQKIQLGKFTLKFFPVDHSIMDAVGVALETPYGTVLHPGDWTYERNPINRKRITYHALAKMKKPTVLMLESLGATQSRERVPEEVMYKNTEKLIKEASGRIIISTFASQIERIKLMIDFAEKHGRKVALDGYSMKVNVDIAKQFGYIKANQKTLIPINKVNNYPDRRVLIICTGAQGENRAVLSRMVNGEHKFIRIKKSDTVVFSSSVIPGNEITIQRLKDNIYRLSDNVVHSDIMDVHSSGHSSAKDMVEVFKQIKPTYFLPVYARYHFLKEAEKLMVRNGFPDKNIFILDNGSIFEIGKGKPKILTHKVPTDYVYVDGLGVGDVSHVILRDRQALAEDGMVIVIAKISDKTGEIIGEPDLIMKGFINEELQREKQLITNTKQRIKKILRDKEPRSTANEGYQRQKITEDLGQYFFNKTKRRPMVIPVLINV